MMDSTLTVILDRLTDRELRVRDLERELAEAEHDLDRADGELEELRSTQPKLSGADIARIRRALLHFAADATISGTACEDDISELRDRLAPWDDEAGHLWPSDHPAYHTVPTG